MLTSFIGLKRWMNLIPAILFAVAFYGTAVSLEIRSPVASAFSLSKDTSKAGGIIKREKAGITSDAEVKTILPEDFPLPKPKPKSKPAIRKVKEYPKLKVVATGYTAGIESTGKRPGHPTYGITYSGVKVRRDHVSTVAADPKILPIGTLLFIPDYGYGVVADTGSKIKGNKIDLYFESTRDVYKDWGKRTVDVQILRRGAGKLNEAWLKAINAAVSVEKRIPDSFFES